MGMAIASTTNLSHYTVETLIRRIHSIIKYDYQGTQQLQPRDLSRGLNAQNLPGTLVLKLQVSKKKSVEFILLLISKERLNAPRDFSPENSRYMTRIRKSKSYHRWSQYERFF